MWRSRKGVRIPYLSSLRSWSEDTERSVPRLTFGKAVFLSRLYKSRWVSCYSFSTYISDVRSDPSTFTGVPSPGREFLSPVYSPDRHRSVHCRSHGPREGTIKGLTTRGYYSLHTFLKPPTTEVRMYKNQRRRTPGVVSTDSRSGRGRGRSFAFHLYSPSPKGPGRTGPKAGRCRTRDTRSPGST